MPSEANLSLISFDYGLLEPIIAELNLFPSFVGVASAEFSFVLAVGDVVISSVPAVEDIAVSSCSSVPFADELGQRKGT